MGLPSSGQLSINDIATEFNVTLTNVALNATLGTYASKGAGVTTAISDFYGLSNITAYLGGSLESTSSDACEIEDPENTYYHNGSGTFPAVGDTVYTNSSGTTTLGSGSHLIVDNSTKKYVATNSSGVVGRVANCR